MTQNQSTVMTYIVLNFPLPPQLVLPFFFHCLNPLPHMPILDSSASAASKDAQIGIQLSD